MLTDKPAEQSAALFLALAARHYLSELRQNRFATILPEFAAEWPDLLPDGGSAADLPAEVARAISNRAAELGVSSARLLKHAALLYLADVDAGRTVSREDPSMPGPGDAAPGPSARPRTRRSPARRPAPGG